MCVNVCVCVWLMAVGEGCGVLLFGGVGVCI
jgi:hypothetical protein